MSLTPTWVLIALVVPWVVAATNPLQGDIWWTLKLGELLSEGRPALRGDLLTFPPHADGYLNPQWLAQLWYHTVHSALGQEGVALVNGLQVAVAFLLVLHLAWRRSGDIRVASLCVLVGSLVAATNFGARAQTLGLLFFAVTLWLLQGSRPASNGAATGAYGALAAPAAHQAMRLVALGAVSVLWANSHGSFWLGPLLALTTMAGGGLVFSVAAALVQSAAALINPHGPELFRYLTGIAGNPVIRDAVTEWHPPSPWDLSGFLFFASLGATGLLALVRLWKGPHNARAGRAQIGWEDLVRTAVFAALGVLAVRNLAWWGMVAPPVWAGWLASERRPGESPSSPKPGLNLAIAGLLVLGMASFAPWFKTRHPVIPEERRATVSREEPAEAADHLAGAALGPRVFAYQPWGGYLEWRLWPRYQPLVDGRIELRPASVWDDYNAISAGDPSWRKRLERHGIRLLVLHGRHQSFLIEQVEQAPEWRLVHRDPVAAVYGWQD